MVISQVAAARLATFDEVVGERVVLRPWGPDDAPELFDVIQQSAARLGAWMYWVDDHQSLEDTEAFLARSVAGWLVRRELGLAIIERASGRILGSSGFHNITWSVPSLEIGYWIRDGAEGSGYVTEAVRLQLALAFDDLQAERVVITCDPANARSRGVPERLGFQLEGQLRNHMRTRESRLRDTALFSMIPADYRAMPIPADKN